MSIKHSLVFPAIYSARLINPKVLSFDVNYAALSAVHSKQPAIHKIRNAHTKLLICNLKIKNVMYCTCRYYREQHYVCRDIHSISGFGGLEVACWPLVPKFEGSNPVEAFEFFSTPSFRREVKPFVPCRRFTACKGSLNVTWNLGIFRQNSSDISRPSSSSFHY